MYGPKDFGFARNLPSSPAVEVFVAVALFVVKLPAGNGDGVEKFPVAMGEGVEKFPDVELPANSGVGVEKFPVTTGDGVEKFPDVEFPVASGDGVDEFPAVELLATSGDGVEKFPGVELPDATGDGVEGSAVEGLFKRQRCREQHRNNPIHGKECNISIWVCSFGIWRVYVDLHVQDRQDSSVCAVSVRKRGTCGQTSECCLCWYHERLLGVCHHRELNIIDPRLASPGSHHQLGYETCL